jgi:hypothetical protein
VGVGGADVAVAGTRVAVGGTAVGAIAAEIGEGEATTGAAVGLATTVGVGLAAGAPPGRNGSVGRPR